MDAAATTVFRSPHNWKSNDCLVKVLAVPAGASVVKGLGFPLPNSPCHSGVDVALFIGQERLVKVCLRGLFFCIEGRFHSFVLCLPTGGRGKTELCSFVLPWSWSLMPNRTQGFLQSFSPAEATRKVSDDRLGVMIPSLGCRGSRWASHS